MFFFQQSTLLSMTGQLLLKLSKNHLAHTTQNTRTNYLSEFAKITNGQDQESLK